MSNNPQVVRSVVVDGEGTVIAFDERPDNLADDEFWSCTYRAVISAACVIQERDSVISASGVFISPDEGWHEDEDAARAHQFVADKLPGGRIIETYEDGDTRTVDLANEESPDEED